MEPQTASCQCSHAHRTVFALAALAIAIIGGVVGAFADRYFTGTNQKQNITYQTGGIDVALKQREATVSSSSTAPRETRALTGPVTALGSGSLTLDVHLLNSSDASLDSRTVLISAATKVVMLTPRDPKVVQAEMADFTKKVQAGANPETLTPPDPFTRTAASASSIAVGDTVSVVASEDIASKKEFSATEIDILPKTAAKQ